MANLKNKTFTLTGGDDYLEGFMSLDLSDIPDCKGKDNIIVDDWNWIILYLIADISSFEDIFRARICNEGSKYNFIWGIIQECLKNDETHKEITSYEDADLWVEIYPKNIFYKFHYYKGNRIVHATEKTEIKLSVQQTIKLLESGVFAEIVDNGC